MVTTIVLLIAFTTAFVSGGYVALKSVQLGLRWQIQTSKQEEPTLEIKNPIEPIIQTKNEEKVFQEQQLILDEWVNGPTESR
ncbi:hypothetical protein SAMN05877753_111160 [Bacillus oleivorans]|uniref:Uncharacterized protein n=1 Tax=Bacillus oleivorans TaxID=1448271 RepID=A0A285D6Q2_9BACI|nr:hypothetical protein [Bacillus oleivorans]SNX75325.1 hypothetical protein SAMN05877753_111160 [Bacillus oleivorans]